MPGETPRRDEASSQDEGALVPPQDAAPAPVAAETAPAKGAEVEKPFDYKTETDAVWGNYRERTSKVAEFVDKYIATGALDAPEVKAIGAINDGHHTAYQKLEWLARRKVQTDNAVRRYPEKATEPLWQIIDAERMAAAIEDQRTAIASERDAKLAELKEKQAKIDLQAEIAAEIKKQAEIAAKKRAEGEVVLENNPPVKEDGKKVEDLMAEIGKI